MRAWEKEAAEGEDFSLNAFTAKTTEGRPMTHAAGVYATLDDWIAHEAIPFSLDSRPDFNAAVDTVIGALGDSVALLGFGEALHGGKELLVLRNQLFQRLALSKPMATAPLPLRAVFLGDPSSTNTCLATVRHPMRRCRRLDLATVSESSKRIENSSSG